VTYLNVLVEKFREVIITVLPIAIIVMILHLTIIPLDTTLLLRFLFGALMIVMGLTIFLSGVDVGIITIGNLMGSSLIKTNKVWIVIGAGLLLGFFIAIAEPDLQVLAGQVDFVTSGLISKWSIIIIVSIGIAMMLALGLVRIVYNIPLNKFITITYLVIFGLALFTSSEFLAISFDASGAVTGALVVPFILAVAYGTAASKKDSRAAESDSFGLVAIIATGPIISVIIMSILSRMDKITASLEYSLPQSNSLIGPFIQVLPAVSGEVAIALLPIIIIFLVCQKIAFKLSKKSFKRVLKGLLYTFAGLVLFLTGVNAGFLDVGAIVGYHVASLPDKSYVIIVGFLLGLVVALAEPSVHVLTHQIEEVTSGYIKRNVVMFAVSIGVGMAVALSMLRIIAAGIHLWHYLLPGYFIAVSLTYFVPKIFVGMSFDSGTVASGPMSATFVLAFAQGVAHALEGADVLIDGFGMLAMVTLMPMITVQGLGFIFKIISAKAELEKAAQ
jgi:hypothetical protein